MSEDNDKIIQPQPNAEQNFPAVLDKIVRQEWDDKSERRLFSVVDVITVLTRSKNPAVYWRVLKNRLEKEGGNETVTKCNGLKMLAADGKMRITDVADVETLLRIIQSIPSPNAEPVKQWLAKVGYERLEEIKDPEKAIQRGIDTYTKKGYSDEWIGYRLRSVDTRKGLRKKMNQKPKYGQCSVLYMEKIKKWKHHFRGIVHKILLNAKDKTLPIAFSPMEHYLDGFDFEYYNFDPNEEELNIDGSYEIEDGRIIRIFVATDVPRSRQRFTIAHEFCHIIQLYDCEFMADMEAIADPTER